MVLCAIKKVHLYMESIQIYSKIVSAKYLYQCNKNISILFFLSIIYDSFWLNFFSIIEYNLSEL